MISDQDILEKKVLLRPDEAARILGVSRRTIYYYCDQGILEAIKLRGPLRIKTESVRRLLDEGLM